MKLLLTILFFSISYCYSQAQIKYVLGIGENGKQNRYVPTALPMTTTVQTRLRNLSDSTKTLWRWAGDMEKVNTDQAKTIKILRDSIAFLSIPDTTNFIGNTRIRQIRKHYSEVEILK